MQGDKVIVDIVKKMGAEIKTKQDQLIINRTNTENEISPHPGRINYRRASGY
jgi:5-enolpyruvylshikimate-3-phosphate synthase